MKKILTIFLLVIASGVQAQNWQEWTQQKKTQIKYLVSQIAAYQVYATYVEKGYAIAKKGLTAIQNIKKGDFSLHDEYFTSLKNVNQKIKLYWKVADIIALQIKIVQSYHQQKNAMGQSTLLTPDEISYCNSVFINLLDGCTHIIDQLILLITDGSLQMKDDERIKRIDALHAEMKDGYVFEQHFTNEANELSIQRFIDANDVRTGRALMNISQ
ncbi:MAG TPA: hypothetical protein VIJ95_05190 [Hanamia sp.]